MTDYVMGRIPLIKQKLDEAIFKVYEVKSVGIRDHTDTDLKDNCDKIIDNLSFILNEMEKL